MSQFETGKPGNDENDPLLDEPSAGTKNTFLGVPVGYFFNYFINGLLNTASLGDYFLMLWIVLTLLRKEEDHDKVINDVQSSALSSYIVVFEICILTSSIGLTETLGIYGSQAIGGAKEVIKYEELNGEETEFDREDQEEIMARPYQLLSQGKVVSTLILVIGTPLFLNMAPLMVSLSGEEEGKESNLFWITVFLTPAAFIKLFTDQEKHFLFCHRKYKWVGLFAVINVLVSSLITFLMIRGFGENRLTAVVVSLTVFQLLSWISVEACFFIEFSERERKLYTTPRLCPRRKLFNFSWEFIKNAFTEIYFPVFIQVMFLIVKIVCSETENIVYMSMFKTMRFVIFLGYGFYIWPRTLINYELGKNLYVRNTDEKRDVSWRYFFTVMKMNAVIYAIIALIMIIFNSIMAKRSLDSYRSEHEFGDQDDVPFSTYIYGSLVIYVFLNIPFIAGCMRSINMKYFLICYNSLVPYFILPFIFYMKFMKRKITSLKPSKLLKDFLSPASSDDNQEPLTLNTIFFFIFLELVIRVLFYLGFLWIKNTFDDVADDIVFKLRDDDDEKKLIA